MSYYEINVALNGVHFFATDKRSCVNLNHTKIVYKSLSERFLKSDGFEISVSHKKEVGNYLTEDFLK